MLPLEDRTVWEMTLRDSAENTLTVRVAAVNRWPL